MLRLSNWELELQALVPECSFYCYESVSSTMDIARGQLEALPALVLAKEQTAGRGRQGRRWDATGGGFAGTFIFAADKAQNLEGYSLIVGCALVECFKKYDVALGLKWPNDICLRGGAKVGGNLIEVIHKDNQQFVLTGIGLNIYEPSLSLPGTGSIFTGSEVPFLEVVATISQSLLEYWNSFKEDGFESFSHEWLRSSLHIGKQFTIESGQIRATGQYKGIDERGRLLLQTVHGITAYASAHIVDIC